MAYSEVVSRHIPGETLETSGALPDNLSYNGHFPNTLPLHQPVRFTQNLFVVQLFYVGVSNAGVMRKYTTAVNDDSRSIR